MGAKSGFWNNVSGLDQSRRLKFRAGRVKPGPPVEGASGLAVLQQATDEIRWTVLR